MLSTALLFLWPLNKIRLQVLLLRFLKDREKAKKLTKGRDKHKQKQKGTERYCFDKNKCRIETFSGSRLLYIKLEK